MLDAPRFTIGAGDSGIGPSVVPDGELVPDRRAVAARVTVNVESAKELARLAGFAARAGVRGRAAVRVNPDFELKTSGMKMAGGPKQFGVDAELVPALLEAFPTEHVDFVGFHIFSG